MSINTNSSWSIQTFNDGQCHSLILSTMMHCMYWAVI